MAPRNPGTRARHRSGPRAERRAASSATRRDYASRVCLDASSRRADRVRVRGTAAEYRVGRGVLASAESHLRHQEMIEMPRPIFAVLTRLAFVAAMGWSAAASAQTKPALKIGVTLHPYYSWTKNVVGDLPGYEVRSILPGEIDAGDYQPRPEDIKKLVDLDVIVVNGIGHDDFIMPMIKASANTHLVIIRINET